MLSPFHLAIPVDDLEAARGFYGGVLGCAEGRVDPAWVDFDFFGHQLTAHLKPEDTAASRTNAVDGDAVPVRHFGVVLPWADWEALHQRLAARGWPFRISPRVRFPGQVGEQGTFFVEDPAGNALEFKSFKDMARLFAR
ncbi:MAG: VOC family protein [Alphaproteobacteria bacterium]|nr:VOC family protein [Alphaproteobacteria bacterium]MCB9796772.1 VOC family protein [Alphaproteobacteria bacterium]